MTRPTKDQMAISSAAARPQQQPNIVTSLDARTRPVRRGGSGRSDARSRTPRRGDPRLVEGNRLLRALPRAAYTALRARLELMSLSHGAVLCEARATIAYVYFPTTAVISLMTPVPNTTAVESALVGSDGMVGIALISGAETSATRAVVQVSGQSYRLSRVALRDAFATSAALRRLLRRYENTLLEQVAQCAACNQRHTVGQRCARWLLMAQDRVGTDRYDLTQDFLGQMLDVTRQSVSVAAAVLQRAGFIRYRRGRVAVTDRPGLEGAACPCYQLIVDDETRALGPRSAA